MVRKGKKLMDKELLQIIPAWDHAATINDAFILRLFYTSLAGMPINVKGVVYSLRPLSPFIVCPTSAAFAV